MRNNNVTRFVVAALLLVNAAALPAWSKVLGKGGAAGRAADGETTFTGLISDSFCKGSHSYKGATRSSCRRQCVAHGADYVFVVDDSVYTLDGHKDELDKLAGGNATVTGHVNGNTIAIDSVR